MYAPQGLEGTAQAIYATVGIGAATALLTLVWVMAALCLLALALTYKLR